MRLFPEGNLPGQRVNIRQPNLQTLKPQQKNIYDKQVEKRGYLLRIIYPSKQRNIQHLNVFGSTANIEANAYQFILVVDDPGLKTAEDVKKLFAEIVRVTHNGVKVNKDIFAKILTQEQMDEGTISDAASLLKQLKRMGISEDLVVAFIGSKEWTDSLKTQEGISKGALSVNTDAKANEIAFAANALFGAVEAVATAERKLIASLAKKLELIQEATSIIIEPKGVSVEIEDGITSYREVTPEV